MELLQYWKIFRKWWWLVVLSTLLFGTGGVLYAQRQVPIYSTSTTMFINPASPSAILPYADSYSVQTLANTYIEFMRTNSFARLVAEQMDNAVDPGTISRALTLRFVEGTQIFRITATHSDPAIAQAIANTVAETLIAENTARQRNQQHAQEQLSDEARREVERLTELQAVLQQEADYYSDRMAVLEGEINALEDSPRSEERDARILDLRDELIRARSARIDVLGSLAQTQTTLASAATAGPANVDTAVIIDQAPLPTIPLPGQARQLIILGFLGGLLAGGGLAWLLEYINYTIRTPEELDSYYGVPTQGVIGISAAHSTRGPETETLITVHEPRSPIAEAFRALRTSVRMANAVKPLRKLLITSSGPSEGKTFVASNLAISLAQEGKRVILVDADLRRPQVHKAFALPKEPGLTNWTTDYSNNIDELLQPTIVPNLSILTCGIMPPNPAELLGSDRMTELIELLDQRADIVLYDSPPAATVTDAVILATQMDGVLQVVRAGVTRIDIIQRCKSLLERVNVHILGPVLNGVQSSDLGYYANYYYYGGYYQADNGQKEPARSSGWFGGKKKRKPSSPTYPAPAAMHNPGPNGTQRPPAAQTTDETTAWTLVNEAQPESQNKGLNPFQRRRAGNNGNGNGNGNNNGNGEAFKG